MVINRVKKKLRNISVTDIVMVMAWALTISIMTMITEYVKTPRPGFIETSFDVLDLAIILAISLVLGILLVDPERILYGFIGAISLSLVISLVCSALYDIHVLELGKYYTDLLPGWEWEIVTWLAFFRIFKLMFPVAILVVFAGGMVGGIVSELMWPHRS